MLHIWPYQILLYQYFLLLLCTNSAVYLNSAVLYNVLPLCGSQVQLVPFSSGNASVIFFMSNYSISIILIPPQTTVCHRLRWGPAVGISPAGSTTGPLRDVKSSSTAAAEGTSTTTSPVTSAPTRARAQVNQRHNVSPLLLCITYFFSFSRLETQNVNYESLNIMRS